jgi:hypothetical protein
MNANISIDASSSLSPKSKPIGTVITMVTRHVVNVKENSMPTLILDPIIFCSPNLSSLSQREAKQYIKRLMDWSDLIEDTGDLSSKKLSHIE